MNGFFEFVDHFYNREERMCTQKNVVDLDKEQVCFFGKLFKDSGSGKIKAKSHTCIEFRSENLKSGNQED